MGSKIKRMSAKVDVGLDSVEVVEGLVQELVRQLDLLGGSRFQDDLSYSQYKAISVIHAHSPVSVGELGRLVGSAQSTTSEMLARLTKAELVAKVRGPDDGRMVMVALTDTGRQLLKRRRKRVREAYVKMFERFEKGDLDTFVSSVRALNDLLAKSLSEIKR